MKPALPRSLVSFRASGHFTDALGLIAMFAVLGSVSVLRGEVQFTRDIQPILANKCYACHGPDDAVRKAELRLDQRDSALSQLPSGMTAVVAGDPDKSAVVHRVFSSDPDEQMPPPDARKQLTDEERKLLRAWIEAGASYELHWSFQPLRDPEPPDASFPNWQHNAVDAFVGERLRAAGLIPSRKADRTTLIRRLSYDLRGLPPSIEEVDAFLQDKSPDAYKKLVRRFLSSEHFGEKLAISWLDLARYGDTNGYHADSHRDVWLYRDWVIHALNQNMPFDQFVREQIAGDLIPQATESQHIATGFNRNAPFNEEGGADPDEFSVVYAVDRANTTGQALLGLTFGCAQCHSHKYDPISQKEYYEFYAFFNSVAGEPGGGGENGHHGKPVPPTMAAISPFRAAEIDRLNAEFEERSKRVKTRTLKALEEKNGLRDSVLAWTAEAKSRTKSPALPALEGLTFHLDASDVDADGKADTEQYAEDVRPVNHWKDLSRHKWKAVANGNPRWIRDGFLGQHPAVQFDGEQDFVRTNGGGQLLKEGFTIVSAVSFGAKTTHQMLVMWGDEAQGKRRALWRTAGAKPTLSFNGYAADVVGSRPLPGQSGLVAFVMKESGSHLVSLELNGAPGGKGTPALSEYSNQRITVGANNAGAETSEASVGEVLIYDRALTSEERSALGAYLASKFSIESNYEALPRDVADVLERQVEDWSDADWVNLTKHYLVRVQPEASRALRRDFEAIATIRHRIGELRAENTTTMVMRDLKTRKPAFVLSRGDFQQPGAEVKPNVPAILGRLPEDQLQTRLQLANWLTRPDHPLVGRVRVNHIWKMLMGSGLVRTAGDFGTQGELPSHPALLDWLTVRFIESGWDTKALISEIVNSATYQQQSTFQSQVLQIDPLNRLLSRAPRFRLTAEEIRDTALASSGLLSPHIGGPSVRPFQPLNYFSSNSGQRWPADTGDKARRRALYTYLQRTAPFPAHLIFDAPSRQICTANRPRTNTPLQALVTMNDPLFVMASGALAEKTLEYESDSDRAKVRFLFRSVLSRPPAEAELVLLLKTVQEQLDVYENDAQAADALIQSAGIKDSRFPKSQLAAWTNLAGIVFNLDEAITRE